MSSIPIDVTDEVVAAGHPVSPYTRIYRATDGETLVKVHTLHDGEASAHGREVYRLSGSLVGPDGHALLRDDGGLAVQDLAQTVTIQADTAVDLVTEIERARFACVATTVRAEANYRGAAALTGVAPKASRDGPAPPLPAILPPYPLRPLSESEAMAEPD